MSPWIQALGTLWFSFFLFAFLGFPSLHFRKAAACLWELLKFSGVLAVGVCPTDHSTITIPLSSPHKSPAIMSVITLRAIFPMFKEQDGRLLVGLLLTPLVHLVSV